MPDPSNAQFMNREREVFMQERASNSYRSTAYFVIKVLYDALPLRTVPAILLGSLVYFLAGLQNDMALFGHFLAVCVMFNIITALVCITIGTLISTMALANLIAIITLLFMMLFQGAMINLCAHSSRFCFESFICFSSTLLLTLTFENSGHLAVHRLDHVHLAVPVRVQLAHGQRV